MLSHFGISEIDHTDHLTLLRSLHLTVQYGPTCGYTAQCTEGWLSASVVYYSTQLYYARWSSG